MQFVQVKRIGRSAWVTLSRGRVNALNPDVVAELRGVFADLQGDDEVRSIVLTGVGSFFSFGFDVPEFLSYSRKDFAEYLRAFTALYAEIYVCPKAVIAALNGHAVAGGCMLAIATDYRVMRSGKPKIGLNEATFGSAIFAGSAEILRQLTGPRNAEKIALTGDLYSPDRALELGLVDEICDKEEMETAVARASDALTRTDPPAFAAIKRLSREPVMQRIRAAEEKSILEFVDIWYSESTREQLEKITIRRESRP